MKIIDAHIHVSPNEYFDRIAREAGHVNTTEHLKLAFDQNGIMGAVVMGNRDLELSSHIYPPFLRYCIGLDSHAMHDYTQQQALERVEAHLQRPNCCGIKLYPGYEQIYVYDEWFSPFLDLAEHYQKPVAIHTGATAGSGAMLKYCHPLTIDEVATLHPKVQFVMCHFGNPWLVDAAAVMEKNLNVAADLSGLVEGMFNIPAIKREQWGYWQQMVCWLEYLHSYDRILYGTDWPLVNIPQYIHLISDLIPERHWDKVFCENAQRIYQLDF